MSLAFSTLRLSLRPLGPADAPAFFAYRSDAQTNRFQGSIPKTLVEAEAFIARQPEAFGTVGTWFQLGILTDVLIGDIGIHFVSEDEVELGCTLAADEHGNGYAREALTAVIEALIARGTTRFTGSVDPRNTASARMLTALGFTLEETVERAFELRGEWVDDARYARMVR